jgi:hypothetical protein
MHKFGLDMSSFGDSTGEFTLSLPSGGATNEGR